MPAHREPPPSGRPSDKNPAERRPTLVDVARRAGVSRATASLVIRDAPGPSAKSRDRVRQAASELGYRPDVAAQLLRRRQSRLIGVMFHAQDPFHADLIEAIYAAAEPAGYDVVLSAVVPTRDEKRAVGALLASRCEALILLGASEACASEFDGSIPLVEIGRPAGGSTFTAVYSADEQGTRLAVDHLASLGHRDIVHIDGGDAPGAAERRAGYLDAMAGHGLQDHVRILPGDFTESSGTDAARELLAAPALPTAVLAGNDQCAVGLLDGLRRAGVSIPARLSIVGYDDSRLARLAHVNLTTVRQDTERLAAAAVESVVDRIENGDNAKRRRTVELVPQLVIRGTTGPPPADR